MTFNLPSLRSTFPSTRANRTSLNKLFDDFFTDSEDRLLPSFIQQNRNLFYPPLDISETNNHYLMEMDLPGMQKNDVDIKIDNNILTIKGKKEFGKEHKDSNFYTRERSYGEFQRSFALPSGVDTSKIDADFKNGVLILQLPKTDVSDSKSIEIKS